MNAAIGPYTMARNRIGTSSSKNTIGVLIFAGSARSGQPAATRAPLMASRSKPCSVRSPMRTSACAGLLAGTKV
ncbi:hypothetical protein D3C72_1315240 [compost metagenome]